MNDEVREEIKKLYALIVDNIYMAESIQVAEAAKLLEKYAKRYKYCIYE